MVSPFLCTAGVVLILLALVADAFIGNVQEKVMRGSGASTNELVRLVATCARVGVGWGVGAHLFLPLYFLVS